MSPDLKRSINLYIDHKHDGQKLLGYKTLNLLNSNSDPTFMREVIYSHIARDYIPAFKGNFIKVVINGESWGSTRTSSSTTRISLRTISTLAGVSAGRSAPVAGVAATCAILVTKRRITPDSSAPLMEPMTRGRSCANSQSCWMKLL